MYFAHWHDFAFPEKNKSITNNLAREEAIMYLTVRLDKENQRFYSTIDGIDSEVRYRIINPNLFEFNYLNVDQHLKDKGVEEELLYNAFVFAQKEGIKVIPGCELVSKYLDKHKEFTCVTVLEQSA